MDIQGTSKYLYGKTNNPITYKQEFILGIIKDHLNIEFKGKTSREAYSFIQNQHKDVKIEQDRVYIYDKEYNSWRCVAIMPKKIY